MNPCYFSFEFELIQKEIAFKFEFEICFNKWALAHLAQLAQPAHLARLSRTGSGLGRSTDPALPPLSPLSSLELSGDNWIAAAAAWSLWPSPVIFVIAAWAR
jgi:hypothetical protein